MENRNAPDVPWPRVLKGSPTGLLFQVLRGDPGILVKPSCAICTIIIRDGGAPVRLVCGMSDHYCILVHSYFPDHIHSSYAFTITKTNTVMEEDDSLVISTTPMILR
jgi:hypothetical protein